MFDPLVPFEQRHRSRHDFRQRMPCRVGEFGLGQAVPPIVLIGGDDVAIDVAILFFGPEPMQREMRRVEPVGSLRFAFRLVGLAFAKRRLPAHGEDVIRLLRGTAVRLLPAGGFFAAARRLAAALGERRLAASDRDPPAPRLSVGDIDEIMRRVRLVLGENGIMPIRLDADIAGIGAGSDRLKRGTGLTG